MATESINDAASDEEIAERITALRADESESSSPAGELFRQLYDRHAQRLLLFVAARVSASEADDIHSDVWLRIWNALPDGFHGGNFRAWAFQIARNLVRDHYKRKRPGLMDDDRQAAVHDEHAGPSEVVAEREYMDTFQACLAKLDEESRTIVVARMQGLGYETICGEKDRNSINRVTKRFHFAKQSLTECVHKSLS